MRAKKERPASAHRPTIMLRRPVPLNLTNSIPPARTAIAEPPEKAADIYMHRQTKLTNASTNM